MSDEESVDKLIQHLMQYVAMRLSRGAKSSRIEGDLVAKGVPKDLAIQIVEEASKQRRRANRAKGCYMCFFGVGLACCGGLITLFARWISEVIGLNSRAVPIGAIGVSIVFFIAGLFNLITGWDSAGGKSITIGGQKLE